jgi:uncharacterized membrane protein
MSGLGELALAALAFVGGHFLLSSAPVRRPLAAALGEFVFAGLYSLLAIAAFAWLLISYGKAPTVELWPPVPVLRFIPLLVMPLSILLVVGGYTQSNPTAVMQPMAATGRHPAPGILTITRHPVMWGIAFWALSHILPNGDAASLILFGGLAALALGGTVAIDAKRQARDPDGFARLAAVTSNVPFMAIREGRTQLGRLKLWRLLAAAAVYFGLMVAHPWIAGVPAM